jgi:hypothetical protein
VLLPAAADDAEFQARAGNAVGHRRRGDPVRFGPASRNAK